MARYRKRRKSKNPILMYAVFLALIYFYKRTAVYWCIGALILLWLIVTIYKKLSWRKRSKKYLESGITEIDNFSGEDFERFLAAHFRKQGYSVELTPKSHDFGADLILKKGGKKIVVQAKRYASNVGVKAIQEVISAKSYYKADKMIVATNSKFTSEAEKLAIRCDVELWNRNRLIDEFEIANVNDFKKSGDYKDDMICPYCEGKLVLKKGTYGEFWACSNYPKCKYTKKFVI